MKQRITQDFLEKTLNENNLHFESFNRGLHYRINNKCDFWPSTSRYSFLHGRCSGHGLQEMINLLLTGQANVREKTGNSKLDNLLKEKNYSEISNSNERSFDEIAHDDIDNLSKEELRRVIVYLSNKLMDAELNNKDVPADTSQVQPW